MNYKIIADQQILNSFIDWLPDLQENELFYCCLFARKKYCPDLVHSSDKTQLKRFTCKKENLVDKLKQLECTFGSYKLKDREVPQEALVCYINPNPRDIIKASFEGIKVLSDSLQFKGANFNPHQQIMSCIQRSVGRKIWVDIDIDEPDNDKQKQIINSIYQSINPQAITLIQTRGGLHCLIQTSKIKDEYKKHGSRVLTLYQTSINQEISYYLFWDVFKEDLYRIL